MKLRNRHIIITRHAQQLAIARPIPFALPGPDTHSGSKNSMQPHPAPYGIFYVERRSSMARAMVPASTCSSSAPTGTPRASRLTLIPRAFSISLM